MAKAELKTKPTQVDVNAFLDTIPDHGRRQDCVTILNLLQRISGEPPVLWGTAIIGFGQYHYKYQSGREGTFFRIGFSPRKQNLTIYIMPGYRDYQSILKNLGKHKLGKSCLYLNKLSDVRLDVLEQLAQAGWEDMRKLYPQ